MLPTGTKVSTIEHDKESGYSRVTTNAGVEGWALTRYLMRSRPARQVAPALQAKVRYSESANKILTEEIAVLKDEREQLQQRSEDVHAAAEGLQTELNDLKRLSANAIKLEKENKQLRVKVIELKAQVVDLDAINADLADSSTREWFVYGAGVLVSGMLLGLVLPRLSARRKSSWGDSS